MQGISGEPGSPVEVKLQLLGRTSTTINIGRTSTTMNILHNDEHLSNLKIYCDVNLRDGAKKIDLGQ